VLKPVDGSGGKGIVIGSQAEPATLARARETILENPRGWIAQREIALSTVPTLIGDKMRPRHVDLRPFAVNNGNSVWVLPGGLTRVALPEGELVVNSSQGGGSKDTWVLAGPQPEAFQPEQTADATQVMSAQSVEASLPPQSSWATQSQTSHLSQSPSSQSSSSQSSSVSLDPPLLGPPLLGPEDTFGFRSQQGQQQQVQRNGLRCQQSQQSQQSTITSGEDSTC
jgi:hypothetical protein